MTKCVAVFDVGAEFARGLVGLLGEPAYDVVGGAESAKHSRRAAEAATIVVREAQG